MNENKKSLYRALDILGRAIRPSDRPKDGSFVVDLAVNREAYCGYDLILPSGSKIVASPYHVRLWKQWRIAQAYARALYKHTNERFRCNVDNLAASNHDNFLLAEVKSKKDMDNLIAYIERNCPDVIIVIPDRDFDDMMVDGEDEEK